LKRDLAALFDSYNRVARLYPALLALAPAAWTVAALKPDTFVLDLTHAAGSSLVLVVAVTLFINIARSRGKAIEPHLLASWGGWRTTVLLRHRDGSIDPFTKARYHTQLQALCDELTLPTLAEEAAAPQEADDRYRSATKRLIEHRRDARYSLLHKENAHYGFRRNLLGLKPIALGIVAFALILTLSIVLQQLLPVASARAVFADATSRWPLYTAIMGDLVYVLLWFTLVRPNFVLQSADEYAMALFRTLDAQGINLV
jgi:hypothetical protein